MGRFGNIKGTARREDWGTAVEVDDDLFRIRLKNPLGQLLVNSYVYRTASELIVVDIGWPWTLEALEEALRDLGLARSLGDVTAWLYTHSHVDHMGGAALLGDYSDAPHYVPAGLAPHLDRWHTFQDELAAWIDWADGAFDDSASRELVRRMNRDLVGAQGLMVEDHGERGIHDPKLVHFGDVVKVAGLELEFVDARGHDPHHGAFFERERGWLFSGDVVIATVTPINRSMGDDLDTYLASLERLRNLDARLILPGHGVQRGGDLEPMFDRSRGYHDELSARLIEILLDAPEPLGLLTLGLKTTGDGRPLEPSGRWLVQLSLIDSHLQKMMREGRVERVAGPRYKWIG